ncbi:MAG: DUF86 domain-containing protein [Rhizobiaceae bacterium]|nr:DUF86 domain-containing protein [Rhizobiaceae bacterium]
MPSERDIAPLRHILTEISYAQAFVEGLTFDDFKSDGLRFRAAIRCLEVISEASRRLSSDLKARHPEVRWRDIAGAGNVYRHDYEDLLETQVWRTVRSLNALRQVVESELSGESDIWCLAGAGHHPSSATIATPGLTMPGALLYAVYGGAKLYYT